MLEIREDNFSLDLLLQETLELTEFMSLNKSESNEILKKVNSNDYQDENDYFMDLADSVLAEPVDFALDTKEEQLPLFIETKIKYPASSGLIYRIDDSGNTFCIRGFTANSIQDGMKEIENRDSAKRTVLKLNKEDGIAQVFWFETKNIELAESIKEQIINRRFPKVEDSVCNISDPGFSWWMDVSLKDGEGRFEIFFKSHAINRAEKYIQLGPVGDGAVAMLRLNQARNLLRSSFPLSEFVCTERSFTVATTKPDHLSFISFKNIFLLGENHTEAENFPDNTLGRTLYFYFHEIAVLRKFWIEVQKRLS